MGLGLYIILKIRTCQSLPATLVSSIIAKFLITLEIEIFYYAYYFLNWKGKNDNIRSAKEEIKMIFQKSFNGEDLKKIKKDKIC